MLTETGPEPTWPVSLRYASWSVLPSGMSRASVSQTTHDCESAPGCTQEIVSPPPALAVHVGRLLRRLVRKAPSPRAHLHSRGVIFGEGSRPVWGQRLCD